MKGKSNLERILCRAGAGLLIGSMFFGMTACGTAKADSDSQAEQAASSASSGREFEKEANEDSEETVFSSSDRKSGDDDAGLDGFHILFPQKATIEQTVLYDQDNIRITAEDLRYENNQAELDLTLENNTDKDLFFVTGSMGYARNSVNGYMTDAIYLNEDVSAGMKSQETIYLDTDMLEVLGITDIADITIDFEISDTDYNTVAETGPLQIRTSLADSWDYGTDVYAEQMSGGSLPGGLPLTLEDYQTADLYNQNDVKIISYALVSMDDEKGLLLEVQNDSGTDAEIAVSNVAMNGLVVCGTTWDTYFIRSGCRGLIDLDFEDLTYDTDSETMGLDEVTSLSFTAGLQDGNGNDLAAPTDVSVQLSEEEGSYDSSGEEIYNQNGVRIISKGVTEGKQSYDDDLHLLFLVENSSDSELFLQADGDSVSVNNTMIDSFGAMETISAGAGGTLDINLMSDSLEKNGISGAEDVQQASVKLTIYDENYNTIDEPTLTVSYTE